MALTRKRVRKKRINNQDISLRDEILKLFSVGERYTFSDVKKQLGELYDKLGYKKTPKAVDIKDIFDVKDCTVFRVEENRRIKTHAYLILKIKEL